MSKRFAVSITSTLLFTAVLAAPVSASVLTPHFVTPAASHPSPGFGASYDTASISLFIDPNETNWIAWNNIDHVGLSVASHPGELFLGPGGFGTDDFFNITVTNESGDSLTVTFDNNDAVGNSFGQQNVLFGDAAITPDSFRINPFNTSNVFLRDEGGVFESVMTAAGIYTFDFDFRNNSGSAGHHDVFLLVETQGIQDGNVPLPSAPVLLLSGLGLLGFLQRRL